MSLPIPTRTARPTWPRSHRALGATAALLTLLTLTAVLSVGCGDEMAREFRQAALGSIESGVKSIADGVLDGLFAVAEPDGSSETTTGG